MLVRFGMYPTKSLALDRISVDIVVIFGGSEYEPIYKQNRTFRECSARDWDDKDYLRIIPRVVW